MSFSADVTKHFVGRVVLITGAVSNSGKYHPGLSKYVGMMGIITGLAKNGGVLVKVAGTNITKSFPQGCVRLLFNINAAGGNHF